MSPHPLVSIVLPTYNGVRYIAQAIKSCLDQSYEKWELIVVDDASTDDTPAKLAAFSDSRIRVIRHQMNSNLPSALNTGFSLARGAYLSWTSDDNIFRDDAIQQLVTFLEQRPDVDVVYTDFSIIDENGTMHERIRVGDPERLIHDNCVGPSFLYRHRVQEKLGGYRQDSFLAEDFDFWLRASLSFRLAPLHEDLYRYRLHASSLTSVYSRERVLLSVERALRRNLPSIPWASPLTKSNAFFRLARSARHRGDRIGMIGCLAWSAVYALLSVPGPFGCCSKSTAPRSSSERCEGGEVPYDSRSGAIRRV